MNLNMNSNASPSGMGTQFNLQGLNLTQPFGPRYSEWPNMAQTVGATPQTSARYESNARIVMNLIPTAFVDAKENELKRKDPVFVVRSNPTIYSTTMLNLYQINKILNDSYTHFKAMAQKKEKNAETMNLVLKNHREDKLDSIVWNNYTSNDNDVNLFKKKIDSGHYSYITKGSILKKFNFLGFIVNFQKDKGGLQNVNVNIASIAEVRNLWGDLSNVVQGTRLYFILKRKEGNKAFYIYPYANKNRKFPPVSELEYTDESGAKQLGHYWYVGYVTETQNTNINRHTIKSASNMNGNENKHSSLRNFDELPLITIAIRS